MDSVRCYSKRYFTTTIRARLDMRFRESQKIERAQSLSNALTMGSSTVAIVNETLLQMFKYRMVGKLPSAAK